MTLQLKLAIKIGNLEIKWEENEINVKKNR